MWESPSRIKGNLKGIVLEDGLGTEVGEATKDSYSTVLILSFELGHLYLGHDVVRVIQNRLYWTILVR
jgi:hypothetical protein